MDRKNLLSRCVSKFNLLTAALSVAVVTALTGVASAADPVDITLSDSSINWTKLGTDLLAQLVTPIGIAIGVGLSVWVIFACVKFFKSGSRA